MSALRFVWFRWFAWPPILASMPIARFCYAALCLLLSSAFLCRAAWERHTIDASSRGADGVRLADFDGDGRLDVTVGWEEGGVTRVYRHPGVAAVRDPWPSVTVGATPSVEDAVFVDWVGDGRYDVVSACEGRERVLYRHRAPLELEAWSDPGAWSTEELPGTRDATLWMFALPVDGPAGRGLMLGAKGANAGIDWAPLTEKGIGPIERMVDAGWIMSLLPYDVDGDGDLDVVASDRRGENSGVYWIEATEDGWRPRHVGLRGSEVMFLDVGDLDRDGQPEIVAAVKPGRVVALDPEESLASWSEAPLFEYPENAGSAKAVKIGDLDRDGILDIAFTSEAAEGAQSGVWAFLREGESIAASGTLTDIGGPDGVKFDRIELVDLDQDGDLDLMTCEERDLLGVVWYENPTLRREPRGQRGKTPSYGPNILFILADDVGMECLGSYGGTSYATPRLDALATSGVRFTQGFSTPKCSPSRVTLLTGRYTFRTTREWAHLPEDERTIGHLLQAQGYRTGIAGKWQMALLKDSPTHVQDSGFDRSWVWAWHEGPRYWRPWVYENEGLRRFEDETYGPDYFADSLLQWMEEEDERPFFAFYSMALAHFPKPDEPKGPNGRWETYGEMIAAMDREVGVLLDGLDAAGLRESTLVVFTGENGTPTQVTSMLGNRAIRGGKAKLTDAGTRVPLMAAQPGVIPSNKISPALVDFTDFFPTFAEVAGASIPQDRPMDGQSFVAAFSDGAFPGRDWIFTEWQGASWVRGRDWKLYGDGRLVYVWADLEDRGVRALVPERAGVARRRLQSARGSLGGD